MQPTFFATPAEFRAWLERHHADRRELLVGFYKKSSGRPSITWPESVDEALCFGWIDGVRRSLGEEAYTIRFTPRQARSTWSAVNVRRARELIAEGRMTPAGLAAFEARGDDRTAIYSYEQRRAATLPRSGAALPGGGGSVGVVPGAPALVPAGGDPLGDERQAARDAGAAAAGADRGLRRRPPGEAAHAPGVIPAAAAEPCLGDSAGGA
jgi:hypothetical protein